MWIFVTIEKFTKNRVMPCVLRRPKNQDVKNGSAYPRILQALVGVWKSAILHKVHPVLVETTVLRIIGLKLNEPW